MACATATLFAGIVSTRFGLSATNHSSRGVEQLLERGHVA
jgi:hypothetical protein